MDNVEILVKTLARPICLERLLRSIRVYYPGLPVTVLDDTPWEDTRSTNAQHCAHHQAHYLEAEPDIGLSAGRNRLVQQSPREFVVILEDDFEFTAQTNLEAMREPLLADDYDILGGALEINGVRAHFEGFVDLADGVLTYAPLHDYCYLQPADIVFNFLMARRLRLPPWDERLHIVEHTALQVFFLSRRELKI